MNSEDLPVEISSLLVGQAGCVALGQLAAHGVTLADLSHLQPPVRMRRLTRQVYALSTQPATPLARAWGAYLSLWPTSQELAGLIAVSHRTALELQLEESRLPRWGALAVDHLTVPADFVGRHRRGLRLHRSVVPMNIAWLNQLPVTPPERTAIDLARTLPREEGLVVLDGLVAAGLDPSLLTKEVAKFAEFEHVVKARELVGLTRSGVDAPPETRLRLAMLDAGLPSPDVDMRIVDKAGRVLARGELGYRRYLIWVEHDGYLEHSDRSAFRYDRSRTTWLQRRGWLVVRCSDADVAESGAFIDLVQHELAIAPGRILALPGGVSPEADEAQRGLLARRAQWPKVQPASVDHDEAAPRAS
jgi:hypothetical protein